MGCAARALPPAGRLHGRAAGWDVLAALGRQEVGRGRSDMARVLGRARAVVGEMVKGCWSGQVWWWFGGWVFLWVVLCAKTRIGTEGAR